MSFLIPKIHSLRGRYVPPGDKSISHRALILASIAEGKSELIHFLKAEDTVATARALKMMGVDISEGKNKLIIQGRGLWGLKKPSNVLDVSGSGTTLRLLTGLLVAQKFSSIMTGDDTLVRRPMKELIQIFKTMGAHLEGHGAGETAPIYIYPVSRSLSGMICEPSVVSAQLKSAVLLAGLYAEGVTEIKEPIQTRNHTELLLSSMGGVIENFEGRMMLRPGKLTGQKITIPGDISSAAFLMTAALLLSHSEIEIDEVGLNPTRSGFLDIVKNMNGTLMIDPILNTPSSIEARGRIFVKSSSLRATTVSHALTVRAIDELPLVALMATQAEGKTQILQASALRHKESNRIQVLVSELSKLGAKITELEAGLSIEGPTPLHGAKVKSYGDHRIAMTLFLAGLIADGDTDIDSMGCVTKSFPTFLQDIQKLQAS